MVNASAKDAGKRLDHFLQEHMPEYSRSRLQEWIKSGRVLVQGQAQKSSYLLRGNEAVAVEPAERPPLRAVAEDIPLEILYEDAAVIAVNKASGVVVHVGGAP